MPVGSWLAAWTVAIVGGQPAATCEFPTSVRVAGCSGTLVHPEIVLYAAHCGTGGQVGFGEVAGGFARTVAVDHCELAPPGGMDGVSDYAYCRLAEPVLDVPITPPLLGCELLELTPGREAYIAGWGATGAGGAGTKHWAQTEIANVFDHWLHVGEDGIGTASGDSGSGAFLRLDDGGWRSIGAASTGGQPGSYVRTDLVLGWIERNEGIDITPCTDAVGTWAPSEACGGFAADPLAGGSWARGCAVGGVSALAATCGPAFGEPAAPPPEVSIVDPARDTAWPDDSVMLDLSLSAEHPWPLRRVWVEIDGRPLPALLEAPWQYEDVVFPEGAFTLVGRAEDYRGEIGESAPVVVSVGVDDPPGTDDGTLDSTGEDDGPPSADGTTGTTEGPPDEDPPGTTTGASEPEGPETTDTGPGAPQGGGDRRGSGCALGRRPHAPSSLLLLAMIALCRRSGTARTRERAGPPG